MRSRQAYLQAATPNEKAAATVQINQAVNLTQEEHCQLLDLTKKGKTSARVLKRAQILLLADQGYQDEAMALRAIASTLMVGESTVHRTRQRYVEGRAFAIDQASSRTRIYAQ